MGSKPTFFGKNIPLDIKYMFLNFAQAYFSEYLPLKWEYDVRTTKIIIADSDIVDIGITAKRPCIILKRGPMSWMFYVRGQDGTNSITIKNDGFSGTYGFAPNVQLQHRQAYTDLVRASIVLNVFSKNSIQVETIANNLFIGLTGFKAEFRKMGIHQMIGLSVGATQLAKAIANTEAELYHTPINIDFIFQQNIIKGEKYNNCNVYVNGLEILEGLEFEVISGGTQIKLRNELQNVDVITSTFRDAITLEVVENATLVATSDPLIYTIPNSGAILGYYTLLAEFIPKVATP